MDDLPVYSLLEAPEHGQGFSTLRIALSTNETEPHGFAAGEQVAVVARRNVSLASVVDGLACTHHRIEIDNPPARAGLLTIRVTPKVPPHAWQQIAVLPVRACHELLARHPDRGATTVPVRRQEPGRRKVRYRPMRPAGVSGPAPVRAPQPVSKPAGPGLWTRLRDFLSVPAPAPAPPSGAGVAELLWQAALTEHNRVLTAYLAYEMDPELVLLYPGVTDVTVPAAAAYHDAAARAGALRTEHGPSGVEHAESYHGAVAELARLWRDCEATGRRLGHSHLSEQQGADLDKAVKLIRHARASHTDFERASYLDRAQSLIGDFLAESSLRVSPAARAQLENLAAARALTRGNS
ncbi:MULTISPECIES: hypothetical protein [Mycolicibacterium]|nr:hypothetical protein [Mycolicibacterium chitae]MCV7108614.1 hypothetical protein [Mycolicibacterium chitae]